MTGSRQTERLQAGVQLCMGINWQWKALRILKKGSSYY